MSTTRERFDTVAATLALVLALGTTGAYAAGKITAKDIADDAVTSRAVKNETLTSADLKDGAIGTGKIQDGSVALRDLAPGVVPEGVLASSGIDLVPPVGPSSPTAQATITLRRPTRVLVLVSADLTFTCPAGGPVCSFDHGGYVATGDGERSPVPGTGGHAAVAAGSSNTKTHTTGFGVIDLPRGTHTASFGVKRAQDFGSTTFSRVQVLMVPLGNEPGSPVDGR